MENPNAIQTVAVIRSIHNKEQMKYEEKFINVPVDIAEIQLSKPDKDRNFYWKGVRYATEDEIAIYSGVEIIEEKKRGRPKAV